eukprot:11414432-Alexandrium_andersonii.AAC.1
MSSSAPAGHVSSTPRSARALCRTRSQTSCAAMRWGHVPTCRARAAHEASTAAASGRWDSQYQDATRASGRPAT